MKKQHLLTLAILSSVALAGAPALAVDNTSVVVDPADVLNNSGTGTVKVSDPTTTAIEAANLLKQQEELERQTELKRQQDEEKRISHQTAIGHLQGAVDTIGMIPELASAIVALSKVAHPDKSNLREAYVKKQLGFFYNSGLLYGEAAKAQRKFLKLSEPERTNSLPRLQRAMAWGTSWLGMPAKWVFGFHRPKNDEQDKELKAVYVGVSDLERQALWNNAVDGQINWFRKARYAGLTAASAAAFYFEPMLLEAVASSLGYELSPETVNAATSIVRYISSGLMGFGIRGMMIHP